MSPASIRLAGYEHGEEEIDAVRAVMSSGTLTNGERTREFEAQFAHYQDASYGVAFSNGTVALSAMMLALGISPGDEVIVPSLTFVSSATSILHVGATPVFAEVDPVTLCIDPRDVEARITDRTRAIMAVHYGGQPADLNELLQVADRHGVALLEDAAEAHGATYRGRRAGAIGRAGMFSFTPTKNITTGEGGMVVTNDEDLARVMRLLRNHGQTELYRHETIGYNWRMTELQAAIGCVQLRRLDGILERKRHNAETMRALIASVQGVEAPVTLGDRSHSHMLYTLQLAPAIAQERVIQSLATGGIESRIYFPPAHLQPIFSHGAYSLPVTEGIARRIVSVPFHARITESDLERIARALTAAVRAGSGEG